MFLDSERASGIRPAIEAADSDEKTETAVRMDPAKTIKLEAIELANLALKEKTDAAEAELDSKFDEIEALKAQAAELEKKGKHGSEEYEKLVEQISEVKNDIDHLSDLTWSQNQLDVKKRNLEDLKGELDTVDVESAAFQKLQNHIKTIEDEIVGLTNKIQTWDRHKKNPRPPAATPPPDESRIEIPRFDELKLNYQLGALQTQLEVRTSRLKHLQEELKIPYDTGQRGSRLDDLSIQKEINLLRNTMIPETQSALQDLETKKVVTGAAGAA